MSEAFQTLTRRLLPLSVAIGLAMMAPAQARGPDGIADVAERVIDAVVNISTSQTVGKGDDQENSRGSDERGNRRGANPQLPPDSPFSEFFDEFFKNRRGQGGQTPRRVNSLGSGFIIDPAGFVVTNNHVIADADEVNVILNDGTTLKAEIVGRDTKTDLALLKVTPAVTGKSGCQKAQLANASWASAGPSGMRPNSTSHITAAAAATSKYSPSSTDRRATQCGRLTTVVSS